MHGALAILPLTLTQLAGIRLCWPPQFSAALLNNGLGCCEEALTGALAEAEPDPGRDPVPA